MVFQPGNTLAKGKSFTPWNKGLTKDDPRVRANIEASHKTRGIEPWVAPLCGCGCGERLGKRLRSRRALNKFKAGHHLRLKSYRDKNPMLAGDKRGALNPNWKGGVTAEYRAARNTDEYAAWRTAVYTRDNFTCRDCDKRGGALNAHHVKSFAAYPELRLVVDNGVTLCETCHDKHDRKNDKRDKQGRFIQHEREA